MQNLKSEITAALVCSPSMNAMRGRWVILPGSTMDAFQVEAFDLGDVAVARATQQFEHLLG